MRFLQYEGVVAALLSIYMCMLNWVSCAVYTSTTTPVQGFVFRFWAGMPFLTVDLIFAWCKTEVEFWKTIANTLSQSASVDGCCPLSWTSARTLCMTATCSFGSLGDGIWSLQSSLVLISAHFFFFFTSHCDLISTCKLADKPVNKLEVVLQCGFDLFSLWCQNDCFYSFLQGSWR